MNSINFQSIVCNPTPPPRQKIPRESHGPRGAPEVSYTSRVSRSTFRYLRFIKKLRAGEADEREGKAHSSKKMKEKQNNQFFLRCDRRSLINDVARRVDLCMQAYEKDLDTKRQKLVELYTNEEKENIRKIVIQAQAGADLVWEDKKERLRYLLEKRRKEHEEKYKEAPLEKAFHVFPCISKMRTKSVKEVNRYQMLEKEAQKMAEKEIENMWHEVAMKESEALAARLEQDAIERYRADLECNEHSKHQIEMKKIQREKERQMLIEESKRFKSMWEEENLSAIEAENAKTQKRCAFVAERHKMEAERAGTVAKLKAEEQKVNETWAALAKQGLMDQKAEVDVIKQKERERVECNKHLLKLKEEMRKNETADEYMFIEEEKKRQERVDKQRCVYQGWAQRTEIETRKAIVDQIKEKQELKTERQKNKNLDLDYELQLQRQLKQLEEYQDNEDLEKKKKYKQDLLDQIAYNRLLKDRQRKMELEDIERCKKEAEDYELEIKKMLCRPQFSEKVHPFRKRMNSGLQMKEKCPCSKPDYCL